MIFREAISATSRVATSKFGLTTPQFVDPLGRDLPLMLWRAQWGNDLRSADACVRAWCVCVFCFNGALFKVGFISLPSGGGLDWFRVSQPAVPLEARSVGTL